MKAKSLTKLVVFLVLIIVFAIIFVTGIPLSRIFGIYNIDPAYEQIAFGLDLKGGVYVVLEASEGVEATIEDLNQTVLVIRSRIDALGVKEPVVTIEGERRIRISIPDISDHQEALDTIGRTAKLSFVGPDDVEILTGRDVASASFGTSQNSSTGLAEPVVHLEFTEEGTTKFAEATETFLGQEISIMLDDEIISSPIVQARITDGKAIINNINSSEEARNLALLIRGGALPLDMQPVQVETIGSILGQDALSRSLVAGTVGVLLVLVFMVIVYKTPGLAADLALAAYLLIYLNCMALLKVTLTLPGIAGIILSVGMAVDANVIIFERIKEEVREGRNVLTSIKSGFKLARVSIIDANATTIIASLALFVFGSGTVQGFALTLMIGVIISMLSSLTLTRLLLVWIINAFNLNKPTLFTKAGGANS